MAISFNGTTDYAVAPENFSVGDRWAISWWQKTSITITATIHSAWGLFDVTPSEYIGWQLLEQAGDPCARLLIGDGDTFGWRYWSTSEYPQFNDGEWHHYVVQCTGGTLELYIDGCLSPHSTHLSHQDDYLGVPAAFSTSYPIMLGARSNDGTAEQFADCEMAHWAQWSGTLTEEQIWQNYSSPPEEVDASKIEAMPYFQFGPITNLNNTDYDSFPGVYKRANGNAVVVYRIGTQHQLDDGGYIASQEFDGATWTAPKTEIAAEAGYDFRESAPMNLKTPGHVGMAYNRVPAAGHTTDQVRWVWSQDDGETWGDPVSIPTVGTEYSIATNPPIQLPSGKLLLAVREKDTGAQSSTILYESTNSGVTWTQGATVGNGPADGRTYAESSLCILPDGSYLCLMRDSSVTPDEIWFSRSSDGTTWDAPVKLGDSEAAPTAYVFGNNVYVTSREDTTSYPQLRIWLDVTRSTDGYSQVVNFNDRTGFYNYGCFFEWEDDLMHVWSEVNGLNSYLHMNRCASKSNHPYCVESFDGTTDITSANFTSEGDGSGNGVATMYKRDGTIVQNGTAIRNTHLSEQGWVSAKASVDCIFKARIKPTNSYVGMNVRSLSITNSFDGYTMQLRGDGISDAGFLRVYRYDGTTPTTVLNIDAGVLSGNFYDVTVTCYGDTMTFEANDAKGTVVDGTHKNNTFQVILDDADAFISEAKNFSIYPYYSETGLETSVSLANYPLVDSNFDEWTYTGTTVTDDPPLYEEPAAYDLPQPYLITSRKHRPTTQWPLAHGMRFDFRDGQEDRGWIADLGSGNHISKEGIHINGTSPVKLYDIPTVDGLTRPYVNIRFMITEEPLQANALISEAEDSSDSLSWYLGRSWQGDDWPDPGSFSGQLYTLASELGTQWTHIGNEPTSPFIETGVWQEISMYMTNTEVHHDGTRPGQRYSYDKQVPGGSPGNFNNYTRPVGKLPTLGGMESGGVVAKNLIIGALTFYKGQTHTGRLFGDAKPEPSKLILTNRTTVSVSDNFDLALPGNGKTKPQKKHVPDRLRPVYPTRIDWSDPIADVSLNEGLKFWAIAHPDHGNDLLDLVSKRRQTIAHDAQMSTLLKPTDGIKRTTGFRLYDASHPFAITAKEFEIQGTSEYTISFWCLINDTSNTRAQTPLGIRADSGGGSEASGQFIANDGNMSCTLRDSAGDVVSLYGGAYTGTSVVKVYTAVRTATTWRLYVNGVEADSGAESAVDQPVTHNNEIWMLGNYNDANAVTHWFEGRVDDIRVWDRALNPAEVAAVFDDCADYNSTCLNRSVQFPPGTKTVATEEAYRPRLFTVAKRSNLYDPDLVARYDAATGSSGGKIRNLSPHALQGTDREGTIVGEPYVAKNSPVPSSWKFNGTDEYLIAGDIGHLGDTYSGCCWVNLLSTTNNNSQFLNYRTKGQSTSNSVAFQVDYANLNSATRWRIFARNSALETETVASIDPVATNVWTHLAFSIAPNLMQFWVNGLWQGLNTDFDSSSILMDHFVIGNYYNDASAYDYYGPTANLVDGYIGDVRIYNKYIRTHEWQAIIKESSSGILDREVPDRNLVLPITPQQTARELMYK